MKTALLSAYAKTDELADFAKALMKREWDIWGSAGTANFLVSRGVPVNDVAAIVGVPILDHRVVTLSREIYAGLLSRPEDEKELERLGLRRIDLLFCDLYPLQEEIGKPGATEQSVIDKTDIGGPTLLRAAAKGRRIALSNPSQFKTALEYIDSGKEDKKYLASLAAEAESVVAAYASASAEFNRGVSVGK
jgi:phosphoribosylaminoimidazolecarboxamide formyltransferase / IMP cyclohydrolase